MSIMSGEDLIRDALSGCKKPKLGNADGIKVDAPSEGRFVDWDDIKVKEKPRRTRKKIENWVTGDFVSYARYLHYKRYGKDWELQFKGACPQVLRVRDTLVDFVGFCDNIVLKDYIEFFFEKHADRAISRDGRFVMHQLYSQSRIDDFAANYDYNERLRNLNSPAAIVAPEERAEIKESDIREAYNLNEQRLVTEYGIIIAVNWLNKYCNLSLRDATKLVYQICYKLVKKNQFDQIRKATELQGPYPKGLKFLDAGRLVKKIDDNLSISVDIVEQEKRLLFLMDRQ